MKLIRVIIPVTEILLLAIFGYSLVIPLKNWDIYFGSFVIALFACVVTYLVYLLGAYRKSRSTPSPLAVFPYNLNTLFFVAVSCCLLMQAFESIPPQSSVESMPNLAFPFLVINTVLVVLILKARHKCIPDLWMGLAVHLTYTSLAYCIGNEMHYLRYSLSHGLTLVLLLLFFNDIRSQKSIAKLLRNPFTIPLLAGLAVITISTIFSAYHFNSLMEYLKFINYGITFLLMLHVAQQQGGLRFLLMLMISIAMVFSFYCFAKMSECVFKGGWRLALMIRLWVANIHPNPIAAFFAAFMPLTIAVLMISQSRRHRMLIGVLLLAEGFFLLLTYSRNGWLSALVGLGVMLVARLIHFFSTGKRLPRYYKYIFIAGMAAMLITLCLFIFIPNPVVYKAKERLKNPGGVWNRFIFWRTSIYTVLDNPLTGLGLRNHYLMVNHTRGPQHSEYEWLRAWLRGGGGELGAHSHNIFLQMAQANGIPGLFITLWIYLVIMKYGLKRSYYSKSGSASWLAAGSFAGLAALMFNNLLDYPFGFSGMALLFAALMVVLCRAEAYYGHEAGMKRKEALHGEAAPREGNYQRIIPVAAIFIAIFSIFIIGAFCISARYRFTGEELRKKGKGIEVSQSLERAIAVNPIDAELYQMLGDIYIYQNRFPDALAAYQKAVALKPTFPAYVSDLGYLYWWFNRLPEAIEMFTDAIKYDPYGIFYEEHYSDLALAYYAQGKDEQARELFIQGIALDHAAVNTSFWKVIKTGSGLEDIIIDPAFLRYRDNKTVTPSLQKEIRYKLHQQSHPRKQEPFSKQKFYTLHISKKDYKRSLKIDQVLEGVYNLYEQVKTKDQLSARAILINLVKAYKNLNMYSKALSVMSQANLPFSALLDVDQLSVEYYKPRLPGDTYQMLDIRHRVRIEEAFNQTIREKKEIEKDREAIRQQIDDILSTTPDWRQNPGKLRQLVELYLQVQDKDSALEMLHRLFDTEHVKVDDYYLAANIMLGKQQYQKAIDYLQKANQLNSKIPAVHNNLGNCFVQLGEYDKAREAYMKAIELNKFNAQAYYNLGNLYYEQGNLERAFEYYNNCINVDTNYYFAYFQIGLILERNELWYNEALAVWGKFLYLTKDVVGMDNYRRIALQHVKALKEKGAEVAPQSRFK